MLLTMRREWPALEASPGLVTARLGMLAELDPMFGGTPTISRWGLLCGWDSNDARDRFLADGAQLRPMLQGAAESWNLSLETVRIVMGDWWGWSPDTSAVPRLAPEEPLLVMTYGFVRPRHLPVFTLRNREIVRDVASNPAMTRRIGFFDTPLARGTLSLWRSEREALDFAYRSQPHAEIQRHARKVPWADAFFFARFRVAAASGTWDGRDPLAELSRAPA